MFAIANFPVDYPVIREYKRPNNVDFTLLGIMDKGKMSHNESQPTLKQTLDAMGLLLGWQQELLAAANEQLKDIQGGGGSGKSSKPSHPTRPARRGGTRQG